MKSAMRILLLVLAVFSACDSAVTKSKRPYGVDCLSDADCAPGYCCTIGFERYSLPTCNKHQDVGDSCRPNGPLTTNGSRYYPNGQEIQLSNVKLMMCSCREELSCAAGTCSHPNDIVGPNHIEDNSIGKD